MYKFGFSKMLQSIKQWRTAKNKRKAEIRKVCVRCEAEKKFQIREWRGKVYICIDSVPLMAGLSTYAETLDMLEHMRLVYAAYYEDSNVKDTSSK